MPQMSPLMWCVLFIIFTSLLTMSLIKIYFSSNKNIFKESTQEPTVNLINNISWLW